MFRAGADGQLLRVSRQLTLVLLASVPASLSTSPACAADERSSTSEPFRFEDYVTWRLEFDNDVVFDSDNQFTNGWSLQKHGRPTHDWDSVGGTPAFGKRVARGFLPERHPDFYYREGWIIGQNLQTPNDIEEPELIIDDVPYAASLAVQNTWVAFDDRRFRGFGWLLGIVGPAALGEPVQREFHRMIGSPEPMGWDHQLSNEPILNLYYARKRKLVSGPVFDLAFGMGAQAGNFLTGADVALETRVGWNLPRGFVCVPDPTGRSLSYDAQLPPRKRARSVIYASVVARGFGVAHSLFMDGNTFTDSQHVDRESFVGELIVGLHYQHRRWGVHLNLWYSTDTIDASAVVAQPDTTADFGSILIEVRF